MKYKLQVYSIWEDGQRKDAAGNPHQEDSIFPAYGKQKDSDRLFILCDGMGGHDAGEVASATVCEAMSKSVLSHSDADTNFSDGMLQEALDAAFNALDSKDTGAIKKMGTTMTFLKLHSQGATIAHMGDSRVYHIRQGEDKQSTKILFVTRDHSLVNDQIKLGEITPEQAKTSPQKNVITRAMQPHMERRPKADIHHTVDIKPGDYFFMCSDGMLEQMEDEFIPYYFSKAAGSDEEKVRRLIQSTKDNRDNHSAIIVHILDVEDPLPIPKETDSMGSNIGEVTDDADENAAPEAEMVSVEAAKPAIAEPITGVPIGNGSKPKKKLSQLWSLILGVIVLAAIIVFAVKQFSPSSSDNKPMDAPIERPTPARQRAVSNSIESASEAAESESDDKGGIPSALSGDAQNAQGTVAQPKKPDAPAKPAQPQTAAPSKTQGGSPTAPAHAASANNHANNHGDNQQAVGHKPESKPNSGNNSGSKVPEIKIGQQKAETASDEDKARNAASKKNKPN